MAKKKPDDDAKKVPKKAQEFKPGNTPYYEYDGTVLNANVPWNEVVTDLVTRGQSVKSIAEYAQCSVEVISAVLQKNFNVLCFRAGARIITLHCNFYPEAYS
jgi:hypothetical protein